MEDLGNPVSYLVLADGTPVYSSDGETVGNVEHVLGDTETDIFDGIVLDTTVLPGGHEVRRRASDRTHLRTRRRPDDRRGGGREAA